MKLSKLLESVEVIELRVADPELDVTSIAHDSRKCTSGSLFVAIEGEALDGHEFIGDALSSGAEAIVCERNLIIVDAEQKIRNLIRVENSRLALARISNFFYGEPSKNLKVIGVTGTNGKSTVVAMVTHALASAGKNALAMTTVGTFDGRTYAREVDLTTPDPVFLQSRLKRAVEEGVTHVAMEVSSHSLSQSRVAGTQFAAGAFTNLTEDHLDFHGNMASYELAKASFFSSYLTGGEGQFAVINIDDPAGIKFASLTGAPVITCSLENRKADIFAGITELSPLCSRFEMALDVSKISQVSSTWIPQTGRATVSVGVRLPGTFNVSNAILAAGILLGLGIGLEDIVAGLESFPGVPGRMERIEAGQSFTVIVDYAHTPDALENVLKTLHKIRQQNGRIILVVGNGGDRDRNKRPICGDIASRMSDRLIITNDNPRTEDPQKIIEGILEGVNESEMQKVTVEPERRTAINIAIGEARDGDIVLIAGKGHEDYQIFGREKRPFSDRDEAIAALEAAGFGA